MRPLARGVSIGVISGALVVGAATAGTAQEPVSSPEAETTLQLVLTPSQQEGPFYPVERPADVDADLTRVDGQDRVAEGQRLLLDGRLLSIGGQPVEGAVVEIWQTDDRGVYLHPDDPGLAARDEAFQGYGESVTDVAGAWSFETILPQVYGSRPRHIHAKVRVDGETVLTTQIYFSGGDIPTDGAVALSGSGTDALIVSPELAAGEDGEAVLTARHLLVIEDMDG